MAASKDKYVSHVGRGGEEEEKPYADIKLERIFAQAEKNRLLAEEKERSERLKWQIHSVEITDERDHQIRETPKDPIDADDLLNIKFDFPIINRFESSEALIVPEKIGCVPSNDQLYINPDLIGLH